MKEEISRLLDSPKLTVEERIQRHLLDPENPATALSPTDKRTLEVCERIHTLRHGYHRRADVVAVIARQEKITRQQAYNRLHQTETIFGKVGGINKEYIRSFLIDECMFNISKARAAGPVAHTKAIIAFMKVAGLEHEVPDLPNVADLMKHLYKIELTDGVVEAIDAMIRQGAVDISKVVAPPRIDPDQYEEAREVPE